MSLLKVWGKATVDATVGGAVVGGRFLAAPIPIPALRSGRKGLTA